MSDDLLPSGIPITGTRALPPPPIPARPGLAVLLWVVSVALCILEYVLFPTEGLYSASATLHIPGTSVLAALLAVWILRMPKRFVEITVVYLSISIVCQLVALWVGWQTRADDPWYWGIALLMLVSSNAFAASYVWRRFQLCVTSRRLTMILATGLVAGTIPAAFQMLDNSFDRLSAKVHQSGDAGPSTADDDVEPPPTIPPDVMWAAQRGLIEASAATLRKPDSGETNVYALAVAGQGYQKLFSREAHFALATFSRGFATSLRGQMLASNGSADLMRAPLATQGNIAQLAFAIGETMDVSRDVLLIYLTSHGSPDAALETAIHGYYPQPRPVSAESIASALHAARIKRRIIIISACYSGTWIKPLATDDSIVITAASADRTSFGCSDDRELTYFGEAFLKGPVSKGASLEASFNAARETVSRLESADGVTPSDPQAVVGRNMQGFWTTPLRELRTRASTSRSN